VVLLGSASGEPVDRLGVLLATGNSVRPMRSHVLAGTLALTVLSTLSATAQPAGAPLAYVQPLPGPAVQSVQERLRLAGVYAGRIDGVWGADSQAALERFQQAHQLQVTGQLNQATATTLGLDPSALLAPPPPSLPPDHLAAASVRAVQAQLRTLGFYRGATDGVWGPATGAALESFQRGRGLMPDGQLGPATVASLGLTPDALVYR
jgi:peptidoglycan hydrolase-like protein with peptidoglycan-binding domain